MTKVQNKIAQKYIYIFYDYKINISKNQNLK